MFKSRKSSLVGLIILLLITMTNTQSTVNAQSVTHTIYVNTVLDLNDFTPTDAICNTGPLGPYRPTCSLRAAITTANNYNGPESLVHINIYDHTYALSIEMPEEDENLGGDLDIQTTTKDILIEGADPVNPAVISGNGMSRVLENYASSSVELKHLVITGGKILNPSVWSNTGAGIYNSGSLTLTDVLIENNQVLCDVSDCTKAVGGGLMNYGRLTIHNSTISNNKASRGSGIFIPSSAIGTSIANTTVHNNLSAEGGAIYNYEPLSMINSTVSSNAGALSTGGIINNGTLFLGNVTLASNYAPNGAVNLYNASNATAYFRNTIFAAPAGIRNCTYAENYSPVSQGYNLFSDDSCASGKTTGDLVNTDPLLGPLANNGGLPSGITTWTHCLRPGSKAINGGNPAGCKDFDDGVLLTDQRGMLRQVQACDIGAYEVSFPVFLPLIQR